MRLEEALKRIAEIREAVAQAAPAQVLLKQFQEELEADLRAQMARDTGKGSALATINAMLKGLKKTNERLAYPWIDAAGRQCICNGFEAMRLKNHLPLEDRPFELGERGVNLDAVFPDDVEGWKTLKMPSRAELKAHIAKERAEWQGKKMYFVAKWDFGEHAPTVNASYLLDLANVFPKAETVYWLSLYDLLYVTCEDGDGILLPIRGENKKPLPETDEERKAFERWEAHKHHHSALSKAHDAECDAARKNAESYSDASVEAQRQCRIASRAYDKAIEMGDEKQADEAAQAYYTHLREYAMARLHQIAETMKFNPTYSVDAADFAVIIGNLYAGEHAA